MKRLGMVIDALRTVSTFKQQVNIPSLTAVKADLTLGLPPKINVGLI